jgi:dipeptidase E
MRQIIALGGGGFSMEPENPLLDEYILLQSRKELPRVCFIPTASGDAEGYIERFYSSFGTHSCIPTHLSLFKPSFTDLEAFILEQDVIYVGGGNTRNLLVLWREWGLDVVLRKAWENGVVLAGLSAGSLCWFEEGVTDSFGDVLTKIRCLGFLPGSHCPHYDTEPSRRPSYHRLILEAGLKDGIAADDGVALHYIDKKLRYVVSSRPNARAYVVRKVGTQVIEEEIQPRYLGASA